MRFALLYLTLFSALFSNPSHEMVFNSPEQPTADMDYQLIQFGVQPRQGELTPHSTDSTNVPAKLVTGVVPLTWRGGCTPTAITMQLDQIQRVHNIPVLGALEVHRRPGLSPSQSYTQLSASDEHMRDYFEDDDKGQRDEKGYPLYGPDRSGRYFTGYYTLNGTDLRYNKWIIHEYNRKPNSIADVLRTSHAESMVSQGATSGFQMQYNLYEFLARSLPDYELNIVQYYLRGTYYEGGPRTFGFTEKDMKLASGPRYSYNTVFTTNDDVLLGVMPDPDTWEVLTQSIDANVPMVAAVNSKANSRTDHIVTVIGYKIERGVKYYACYNTWSTNVTWYKFQAFPYHTDQWDAFCIAYLQSVELSKKPGATRDHFNPNYLHRFTHPQTGAYFYTANPDEAADVYLNSAWGWKYEGPEIIIEGDPANGVPVYRFFNTSSGSHFYTISEQEKVSVIRDLPHVYKYEGVVFYASPGQRTLADKAVHRFYLPRTASHFFSANEAEVQHLRLYGNPALIRYEGISWYAPRAPYRAIMDSPRKNRSFREEMEDYWPWQYAGWVRNGQADIAEIQSDYMTATWLTDVVDYQH